jgi:hypothetical protein
MTEAVRGKARAQGYAAWTKTHPVPLACTHASLHALVVPLWLLPLMLMQLWEAALRVGADAMLAGMGQVRKCSQQGRAAMSLDLSAVEKSLRPLAPATALSSLRRVGLQSRWTLSRLPIGYWQCCMASVSVQLAGRLGLLKVRPSSF